MKQRLLTMLFCLLTVAIAFAGKEESYVLYEGFESGSIPADWSLEYVSDIQQPWSVESSAEATYPSGSYAGRYHVALRNTTHQTQHYVTRLITPVFDISGTFQPILVFSHAQAQRTGDVDILRVYYRTSSQSRWVQIGEYTDKVTTWQTDTIALTAPTESYQLAFEGTDRFGRGIALDDIIVRPTPTCDDPFNVSTDGLSTNSCVLRWNGSLDTDSFHVALSTTKQTDPDAPTDIVQDTHVYDFQWSISGLKQNTHYYAYIQAHCGDNVSEWVEYSFWTKNLVSLPYTQDFNMPYVANRVNHVSYWSNGTSILKDDGEMEYMPFVNQFTSESSWDTYSYSKTTCYVFTGARTSTTPIPAGQYVYAATPELDTDDIRKLQVRFWGTCADYVGENYAGGLIVGVMTDPTDFSTFVPVDTVYITKSKVYDRFTVYLDKYQGEGKYVGFASNFVDKDNIFYLDDVEIKEQSGVKEVSNVRAGNYGAASFQVSANLNGNQRAQLLVMRDTANQKDGSVYFDPLSLPADYQLVNVELSASQLPYTVQLPEGGRFVQVYMRGIDGTGYSEFALPVKVLVPMGIKELPFSTDFKDTDPSGIWSTRDFSNFSGSIMNYTFPYSILSAICVDDCGSNHLAYRYTDNKTKESSISLGKEIKTQGGATLCEQPTGDYIALPALGEEKDVFIVFYMERYSSSVANTSRVAVGMMSNPFDPYTFDTIAICEAADNVYRPFIVSLAGYKGKGIFPAIMAADAPVLCPGSGGTFQYYDYSNQRIKSVALLPMDGCIIPSDFACTPEANKATITWSANGMSKWVVKLYADEKGENLLRTVPVSTNKCVLEDLAPHTTYYYSVHTDCDTIQTEGSIYTFVTECYAKEPIPYVEDFESWKGGSNNPMPEPLCWTFDRRTHTDQYSTNYYPYVSTYGAYKGKKCFDLYYTSSLKSNRPNIAYVALPEMEVALNQLQVQFYAKPGGPAYAGDTLFVGVMSDPEDLSTFDTIAVCQLAENAYAEYIVRFNTYTGQGKYIAFASAYGKETRTVYLDNIKVDYLSDCAKVQGVSTKEETIEGATVYWDKGDASKWEVLLATTDTVEFGSTVAVDGNTVLSITTVDKNSDTITNCPKPNTRYYVFVRSVCSETNKGDWSLPASFKTACASLTTDEMGLIDFSNKDELDCWIVGMRKGGTATNLPTRNTNGYLYMFNVAATDGAYAIMPELNIDSIARLQISFDAHGGNDASYLREITVGVISNPSDLSTFTAIKTVSLNRVSATNAANNYGFDEGARYTVRFNGYDGDFNGDYGTHIMFLSESGSDKNYVYIDNIKVDSIGECMEPIELSVREVNAGDATIEWEDLGGDYQIQLLDAKGTTVLQDTTVRDTNAVKLSHLDYLTTYRVQVRHICAADEYSVWSNKMKFKTTCPASFPLPYSENFDAYPSGTGYNPDCWEIFTSTSATASASSAPCVYSSAKKDGTNGFHMFRNTTHYTYVVLPKMALTVDQLLLSFDWRNANTSNSTILEVGVATDVTSKEQIDATFKAVATLTAPAYKTPDDEWHTSVISLAGSDAKGHIVLRAPKAAKSAESGAVYIDNLYLEAIPTCFRPLDAEVLSTTTTSAKLTWKPYGEESAWDIAYVPAGGDIADATIVPADKDTFTVSGLTHSTVYDFYVRANCGEGDVSSWSRPAEGTTLALVELADAHWNFDDINTQHQSEFSTSATYKIENGWLVGNTKSPKSAGNIPYNIKNTYNTSGTINAHYALSDSCALQIGTTSNTTNGAYAILPEINADLDGLQIRFSGRAVYATGSKVNNADSVYYYSYATGTYKHAIQIGTVTDPYDPSTFELLCEYTFKEVKSADSKVIVEDGHWEEVIVPLYGASGKYIAFMTNYAAGSRVYIDDVVVEQETGCAVPMAVNVVDLAYDRATVTWKSGKQSWQVQATIGDSIIESAIVDKPTWETTLLEETTDYTIAVRAICGEADTSAWSAVDFTTPCSPFDAGSFVFNFEDNLYPYIPGQTAYNIPQCWDAGQLVMNDPKTYSYMPQSIANTKTTQYSRNVPEEDITKGRALRFYNNISGTKKFNDGYVILPETDFRFADAYLHFWIRAAYFYSPQHSTASNRNKLYTANNNYQRQIIIGAIANADDPKTFVPLDTVTYSKVWTSNTNVYAYNDESGNDYWEEVLIPLKDYAGKGRIAIVYPGNDKTGYFFIDDMEIVGDFCSSVTNLQVNNIRSTTADLSWMIAGTDSVQLQLAYNADFDDANIAVDTVLVNTGGHFHATNLLNGRDYYFRVRHLCNEEEISDWTASDKFVMDYAVRFAEDFNINKTYPVDWQRANKVPEEVFAGTEPLTYVSETGINWQVVSGTKTIAANEMRATTSGGTGVTNNWWLITPTIDLTMLPADTTLMLSFRLGLTNQGGGLPNPTGEGDKFLIAVSEDAGATWHADTWWSDDANDDAKYSYAAIPATGQLYNVDMAKYIGKRIQIAFISSSTKTASKNYLLLATVSLNHVDVDAYRASICQWNDYQDQNFFVDADNLVVGETTTYNLFRQATRNGQADRYASMSLTVYPDVQTILNAEICEGTDYVADNFLIENAKVSRTYKQKLTGSNTCDSVVVLNLSVTPSTRSEVHQTICRGDFYEFNGAKYYLSTVHTDTLSSLVTGCDSITTLYLTVNAILEGENEIHLCEGESVEFGKFGAISEEGVYQDTLKNALNCDSVATLHVYTHDAEATTVRALICQGEKYSNSVWSGLTKAGDYPSQQKTVWGCDSIATLHLLVADASLTVVDSIETDELPYVLNDTELLPEGTTEGTYVRSVTLTCGVANVTIVVGQPMANPSVFVNSLAITPNPARIGQDIQIFGDFAADATIEVISATGTRVYFSDNMTVPAVIPGIHTAGVYIVNVTSNGQLYQSKLVVK